jgi:hypothetical protein
MPNDHDAPFDEAARQHELITLRHQLAAARAGNAKVIYALDRAMQLIEVLIAYLPEGQPVHPGLETAQNALREALKAIRE